MSVFDISPDIKIKKKYLKNRTQEDIKWMIEHSHPKSWYEYYFVVCEYFSHRSPEGSCKDLKWIDDKLFVNNTNPLSSTDYSPVFSPIIIGLNVLNNFISNNFNSK